jgi:DNA-binding SARP family transcriptional activator/tetratricopeptide (TPR) repeat protein
MDHGRDADVVVVRLLGRPQVRWSGGSDDLLTGMPKRLLAYLAVRGGDVGRDEVALRLWPTHDLERRRGNLRRLLGRAKALPYAVSLGGDRERLWWRVTTDLDVVHSEVGDAGARAALLAETLLDGVNVDPDDAFSDWLREERHRLARLRRQLLLQCAEERRGAADFAAAAATLERLVAEDPLDEEALQRLLAVAGLAGAQARARAAYRRFATQLQLELGLLPLETTQSLAGALRDDGSPPPPAGAAVPRPVEAAVAPHEADAPGVAAPSLAEAKFVGYMSPLARIRGSLAPLLIVTGDPGVGKSATVRAATAGARSLWLRAQDAAAGHPFGTVEAVLRRELPLGGGRIVAQLEPWERSALAHLVPEARAGTRSERRIVDAGEGRGRIVAAAAHALCLLSGADGVLVVDDLHELDAASVDVVSAIIRRAGVSAPAPRVLATARPTKLADAPLRGAVARLEADGLVEYVELEGWDETEVHMLVNRLSGVGGGRIFAHRLHAATGGNPLFVLETLRHLFAVGMLRAEETGGWSTPFDDETEDYGELPLPSTVRDAVCERVARLDAGTQRLLEAAALAVPPFTLELIAPATALSEWLALEALERAVRAGLLVASGDGYRFGHDLLRSAIANGLGSERRALVERRLAWALERERGAPSLIAAHFERAGRRADAYRWRRRAAEEAASLYVPGVAVEHLERAAELAEHDRERVETCLEWAGLLDRTVDPRARRSVLERAQSAADRLGDPALEVRVAIARMRLSLDLGEVEAAQAVGDRARDAAITSGAIAELQLERARVHLKRGDAEAAQRELDAGAEALAPGPSELSGRYHLEGYVSCAHLRGDSAAAFDHVREARAIFEAVGHQELLAEALNFHGIFAAIEGRREDGVAWLEQGLALAREVGHVAVQRRALLNLVKLHTDVADAAAAAPLVAEGLALAHDFEQRSTEVAFLLSDGYVRYLRGELGGAARAFARATAVADEDGNPVWRVFGRLVAATPLIHAGDLTAAATLLDAAEGIVATHALTYLQPRVDSRRAALALASGDPERALELLDTWSRDDGVAAEERGEHACLRAAGHAALGDHRAALEAADGCAGAPTVEVRAAAEAVALEAAIALGNGASARVAAVQARLDDGRVPPFETLALLRALARAHALAGDDVGARDLERQADEREERLLRTAANVRSGAVTQV